MAKIITVPNPLLREKSKVVKSFSSRGRPASGWGKKTKRLVDELIEAAKKASDPEGVGLSAVQIGKLVRIFVVQLDKKFILFLNPKITWRSKKMLSRAMPKEKRLLEGCLSIPGYYGFVERPWGVKLQWQDLKGQVQEKKFEGKEALYLQHEYDHLDGILFVDRILEQGGKIYQIRKTKDGEEELVEVEL